MMDEVFEKGLVNFIVLSIVTIALCVVLDLIVRKRFSYKNKKNEGRATANMYLSRTIRFLIWLAGSQVVLRQIKPLQTLGTTIMGASSIFAAAASLAAQSTFANYVGGFSLATSQPFKVGDAIYLKNRRVAGIVKDISFRHTLMETKTGTIISIPNSSMNQEMIEDLTNGGYARELEFRVGPDTNTASLEVIIKDALSSCPLCMDTETPHMEVESFSAAGYTISFVIRTANMHEYIEAKNEVLPALYTMLRENGITVV